METLPVTLIVKAPNQQIEDQTIKCELSWTIHKLKQHLSEVYPSKPPKQEQKLIYSGQLLSDSVTLKDILRQYEGQDTHTVHLVCSPKYSNSYQPERINKTPPMASTAAPTQQENPQNIPNTQHIPENNRSHADNTSTANNTESTNEQTFQNIQWGNTMNPMDANHYAMQMAWMQQSYLQYMHYMQMVAAHNAQQTNANLQTQNQPEQRPARRPQMPRDPDNPERDWLDVFYMMSRAMVLFSVVYFYSSPIRLFVVLILGIGLYLYQIGLFRHNVLNNNNNNVPNDPVRQEETDPSRLMIVWTFFTTFFASLIPEVPNAI